MKKIILSVLAVTIMVSAVNAQAFNKGDKVLGLGLGIGGNYKAYNGNYSSQSPAIGLSFEKGTNVDVGPGVLGLGVYVGYKRLSYDEKYNGGFYNYNYDWTWTYTIIGFRGAYHYDLFKEPKLDTYGGAMLSYNIVKFKDNTNYPSGYNDPYSSSGSGVGFTLYLGGRYYFTDKVAAFAELGYGISYLTLGVAVKL